MISTRRAQSVAVRRFGRRQPFVLAAPMPAATVSLSDDVKLFASTFFGGLLFMTIYLA